MLHFEVDGGNNCSAKNRSIELPSGFTPNKLQVEAQQEFDKARVFVDEKSSGNSLD